MTSKLRLLLALLLLVFLIGIIQASLKSFSLNDERSQTRISAENRILAESSAQYQTQIKEILDELPLEMVGELQAAQIIRYLDGTTPFKPPKGYWKYILSFESPWGERYEVYNSTLFIVARNLANSSNQTEVANNLLVWVHSHMKYDSTLGGKNWFSAPQIFQMQMGVCHHYSILYITLCRSLGIPARYVHSRPFDHGWAEVYINGAWIQADPAWLVFGNPKIYLIEASRLGERIYKIEAAIPETGREAWNRIDGQYFK